MKILFIFKSENFLAPVGLCTISAVGLREGHKTYLCEMNSQDPLEYIAKLRPDVVAYSSSTGEAKYYLRLNRLIKEKFPDVFTIMGGPHPTFFPQVIFEDSLDAICIGEGESAFVDLLYALNKKEPIDVIPNILTKNNKENFIIRNLVENLDTLPLPDYALLYDNTPMGRYPLKSFIVSRGCSYDCTYCFNASWRKLYAGKGKLVRRHSVDYIIDDIRYVKNKWPLSFIKFYDDIFTYSADDWLEEFSKKYKNYIDLPFFILTRADLLTEDIVKLLKYAGCRTISMSIEAGNAGIRDRMLKRHMSDEQIIKAHRLCEKYSIHTFTNCIVGLPGASIKNELESVNLAIKAKADWAEFPIFHPYPGTELGQQSIALGFYKPDFEKMHTSYMYSSPLSCFIRKEKNIQMNLSVLGAVAIAFPGLKGLIVRFLIYMPHSPVFTLIYYLTKTHIFRKKIYITKTTFFNWLRILERSLRQEWRRHEFSEA
ncbi:MAG: radical SAM protein [Candidatus Omnitrophica bacterium]|nr:radical SAM protein [Candidatus Omnitrophota bacterium]